MATLGETGSSDMHTFPLSGPLVCGSMGLIHWPLLSLLGCGATYLAVRVKWAFAAGQSPDCGT